MEPCFVFRKRDYVRLSHLDQIIGLKFYYQYSGYPTASAPRDSLDSHCVLESWGSGLQGDALWKVLCILHPLYSGCCDLSRILGFYASGFIMIVISLDRLSAIMFPISHISISSRTKLMLTIAWIMAPLCSLPQVIIQTLF